MNFLNKVFFILFLFNLNILKAQIMDHSWREVVETKEDAWFATDEAKAIAENVLLYQRNIGGWPKNVRMQNPLNTQQKDSLLKEKKIAEGSTFDNGATILEMKFLSKLYKHIPDERYKKAFLLGLTYVLDAQYDKYDNGGWPQFFPYDTSYYRHITYNDNSMVNILELLNGIIKNKGYFSITPDKATIARAKKAFNKGIDCIIKTQYKQNGVLTVWCAQHDEKTLLPAKARAYELPSLSGQESAGIVLLLMSLDNPSKDIKNAINCAVAWFEKTKIIGWKQEWYRNESNQKEKRLVPDSTALPIWARFMELENNKPFFCDRDGIKKSSMMEIGRERRAGYGWYSDQPRLVLEKYPEWKTKWDSK
jgi:pectinesterase